MLAGSSYQAFRMTHIIRNIRCVHHPSFWRNRKSAAGWIQRKTPYNFGWILVFFSRMEKIGRLLARTHPGQQVIAAVHAHFGIDVMQVGFDRRQSDHQFAGDIRVAFALDDF